MTRTIRIVAITAVATASLLLAGAASAARATRVAGAIWVNNVLYDTVVTDTSFTAPPERSTDTIYSFMLSGLSGQRSIADAAPGDPAFNGGRWSVRTVVFTPAGLAVHDPDGDGVANFELTSVDDLMHHEALGHVEIFETSIYFECPVLPRRNR